MKRTILIAGTILTLSLAHLATAAPTSTTVINLRITSTTSYGCLGTDSTGLVILGTCTGGPGGGGSVSTSSPISINNFPFWVTTGGALSGTSTLTLQGGSNLNVSGTILSNGTLVMLQGGNISLLTNNSGYITVAPATTTINQMQLSAFTFLASGQGLTVATSAIGNITYTYSSSSLNLGTAANQNISAFLQPSSNLSDVSNVSSSLVNLRLASGSTVTFLNLFANAFDPSGIKYITSTPAVPGTSTIIASGGTATGPAFTFVTSTIAGIFNVTSSGGTVRFIIPPANDQYFAPSSTIIIGAITTSTYNASITVATAAPLGGGGKLTNNGTLSLTCTGCLTSLTGAFQDAATSTAANTFTVSTTTTKITITIPPKNDPYFAPSSTISSATFSFGVSFSSSSATQSAPLRIPYSGNIFAWRMTASPSCSGQYDVWKASGAIPTKANTIVGTDFPTLSSQTINSSTALTGWTKTFAAGDYFIVSATSTATTCNAGTVELDYTKQ